MRPSSRPPPGLRRATAYLENGDLTPSRSRKVSALLTISLAPPVYCGTALRNMGVQPVSTPSWDFLPSPLDIGDVRGFLPALRPSEETEVRKPDETFSALGLQDAAHPSTASSPSVCVLPARLESGSQANSDQAGKKRAHRQDLPRCTPTRENSRRRGARWPHFTRVIGLKGHDYG